MTDAHAAADAVHRAMRAYGDKHGDIDGPYAEGFFAEAMVEALEAEGWKFAGDPSQSNPT